MWNVILYQPLFNLLIIFYNFLGHNMGVAIIAVTLLVRLVLLPLTGKSLRAQKKMTQIKPHLDKLKKDHGHDQKLMAQKTMELYKEHGINPLSSCLPLLIQFPIFIALYRVFYDLANATTSNLYYSSISRPESINTHFLWFDLAKPDIYYILPILVGVTFYLQSKMMTPKETPASAATQNKDKGQMAENFQAAFSKQMLYIFPVMFTFISLRLPSALSLYWVVTTVFGIAQQNLIMRDTNVPQGAAVKSSASKLKSFLEKGKSGKTKISVKKRGH